MTKFDFTNFRSILIDFDGVIANTNLLKEENIYRAASNFVDHKAADSFKKYFVARNGLPRELKTHLYFNDVVLEKKILASYRKFNRNLLLAELAPGIENFLEKFKTYYLVVLSGGDFKEVLSYLQHHQILHFFSDVLCGPKTKDENLKSISILNHRAAVFIGDSIHDYEVALRNKLEFIYMFGWSQDQNITNSLGADVISVCDFNDFVEMI